MFKGIIVNEDGLCKGCPLSKLEPGQVNDDVPDVEVCSRCELKEKVRITILDEFGIVRSAGANYFIGMNQFGYVGYVNPHNVRIIDEHSR